MPGVSRTRSLACALKKAHERSHHQVRRQKRKQRNGPPQDKTRRVEGRLLLKMPMPVGQHELSMAKFLEIEDVEKAAALFPETFFIPSASIRESQKTGDSVRLHFLLQDVGPDEPRAERIWVTIVQAESTLKTYKGTLETSPVFFGELKVNDEVSFEPRHIAQTIIKNSDPRWIDSSELKAFVSNMCLEQGNVVRFLYREEPDGSQDSGWRMFSGNEPEGYLDDPSNIRLLNVGFILDRDPTLLEPLRAGTGEAFEREDLGKAWQKVTDWNPNGD